MKTVHTQTGATLVVAMIILLMMTLFAVSSINMSNVNLKIVGNLQAQKTLDARAQDVIEQFLSDPNKFDPSLATSELEYTFTEGTVTMDAPVCLDTKVAAGYTAVVTETIMHDNTWELVARMTDDLTGAVTTLHQGVAMRMLAGHCE